MEHTPVDPQFVLEHAAHVRALAGRLVFDGTRADDLEQETWLAALKNAPREMTSPRGWLARIAQRRAVHDWRAESRRAAREQASARAESVASSAEILEREETRAGLVRAVLALDEPYRSALVAQFLEEHTPSEAARRRGVPVETQRTHVKRGLEQLRERLKRGHGAAFGAFQLALVRDLRLEPPVATMFIAAGSGIGIGGLSMGTATKVAAAVLVAAAAWLVAARPWAAIDGPGPADAGAREVPLAAAIDVARPATVDERKVVEPRIGVESASATSGGEAKPAAAAVVVVARVVDENGRPLAGASGRLASRSDPWNETTPRTVVFRGTSGDDGVLRIETPATNSAAVDLTIDAGPWRTQFTRTFEAGNLDRIVPGVNDAGELMLRPAGRVRGRVLAEGAAVAEATVRASSPVWTGAQMKTSTGLDGSFVIESVDPSVDELQVTVPGSTARVASRPVAVYPGIETDAGEIELESAPSIAGRVTDARGAPIAGVVVGARPVRDVRGWENVATADDGTFVFRAAAPGEYDVSVAASQLVRAWSANGTPAARFATGERDVRIVLERVSATTFRVVTEAGTPVLEFGLGVRPLARIFESDGEDRVDYDEQWPPVGARRSNEVVEPAEPGVHEVFVAAPGFVPLRAPVAHDAVGGAVQTLVLLQGRAIRGRVVRAGTPLASAQLVVERAWIPLGPEPARPGAVEPGRTHAHDVAKFAGRTRSAVSGSDGTFEIEGLAAGTYDVRVALAGVVVARADGTIVPADADRDLGDLVIRTGATVRGVVDAGAQSPVGWTVSIRGRDARVIDRSDGRFEFTGLESGVVELTWHHEAAIGLQRVALGPADARRSTTLELADGATREVRIDVADLVPARVSILVRADGEPLADVMPTATTRVGDELQSTGRGMTRADGTWSGLVAPGVPTVFDVPTADGLALASSTEIVLAPGEQRAIVLESRTGVLEVRLPEGLSPREADAVRVDVRPVGTEPRSPFQAALWRRVPREQLKPKGTWTSPRTACGRVGAGTWTARIEVLPAADSTAEKLPVVERTITVRAGETTTVELP